MDLLRQNEGGKDHVADGKVRQKDIRHRSHFLDLHHDDHNAHVAEETNNEKRRDEGYKSRLAVRHTHRVKDDTCVFPSDS